MASNSLTISENTNITSLDLSSLQETADNIQINSNSSLISIDLSSFYGSADISIYYNSSLQSVTFHPPGLSPSIASTNIDLSSNALTESCVDDILELFDSAGNSSGSAAHRYCNIK